MAAAAAAPPSTGDYVPETSRIEPPAARASDSRTLLRRTTSTSKEAEVAKRGRKQFMVIACLAILSVLSLASSTKTVWTIDWRSAQETAVDVAIHQLMTFDDGALGKQSDVHISRLDNKTNLLSDDVISPSLKTLLDAVFATEDVWDKEVDSKAEAERCQRYGFNYDGRTERRRIFWGSLIADDSWHVLNIAAMEAYGIYDTVALVESNKTQMQYPRDLRFPPGSKRLKLLQSGMWGTSVRVSVDYYEDDPSRINKGRRRSIDGLYRENLQRDMIIERWKQNGMTADDIGFISDIDEVATRDFLRALQVCEVPEFRPDQDCKAPKVICSTLVFEGSPDCIEKGRRWYHPDLILGECIDGIGDPQKHKPSERTEQYGVFVRPGSNSWGNTDRTMFPLWDATDFRMGEGGRMISGKNHLHTAFHFHNFFDSLSVLRNKYKTYGHPVHDALEAPLGLIHKGDVGFMVDCLMNRTEEGNDHMRVHGGWKTLGKDGIPIAFQKAPAYADLRHQELQQMMVEDEKLHPRKPELEHA